MEELSNQIEFAESHRAIAKTLSDLYEFGDLAGSDAKLVFENPIAYIQSGNLEKLSDDLRERWLNLQWVCAYFVINHTGETRTSNPVDSLRAVQEIVESGIDDIELRGAIAGLMDISSHIFVDSAQIIPGDSSDYVRNIEKMSELLPSDSE